MWTPFDVFNVWAPEPFRPAILREVTDPPPKDAPGKYLILIEGVTIDDKADFNLLPNEMANNFWKWDGQDWDHKFIRQDSHSGMKGRRLFWLTDSRTEE
jgi:hypothetical protein